MKMLMDDIKKVLVWTGISGKGAQERGQKL